MATTSLWRVHGWLGKVVVYVEKPDKTENPKSFEKNEMTEHQTQGLTDVIEYAVNMRKTAEQTHDETAPVIQQFVSGVNVNPVTARDSMMRTKKEFDKTGGVVAYHGYQSFAPGEATPDGVCFRGCFKNTTKKQRSRPVCSELRQCAERGKLYHMAVSPPILL